MPSWHLCPSPNTLGILYGWTAYGNTKENMGYGK